MYIASIIFNTFKERHRLFIMIIINIPADQRKKTTFSNDLYYERLDVDVDKVIGYQNGQPKTIWYYQNYLNVDFIPADINSQFAQIVFSTKPLPKNSAGQIKSNPTKNIQAVRDKNRILFCSGMFSFAKTNSFANTIAIQIQDIFKQYKNSAPVTHTNIISEDPTNSFSSPNIQSPISQKEHKHSTNSDIKPIQKKKKKAWPIVIVLLICVFLVGKACGSSNKIEDNTTSLVSSIVESDTTSIVESSEESKPQTEVPETKYESKITWAALSSYCCAVEIDSYDGDIIEAGTYRFYPDLVSGLENGRIAIVWDIYVSDKLYNQISELKDDEYQGTVGGISKNEITIKLEKGQYVYVKYNPVANNDPTGVLMIEKQ